MALNHADPGEIVNLAPDGGPEEDRSTAIVKTDQFEAIRLVVPAGVEIPRHAVPGQITLHCLEGHVVLGLDGSDIALKTHDWVYLDGGAAHSVRGVEDSSLLLMILFPGLEGARG